MMALHALWRAVTQGRRPDAPGLVAVWLGAAFLVETERFLAWERSRALGGLLDDH
jgi:hypothetical protein